MGVLRSITAAAIVLSTPAVVVAQDASDPTPARTPGQLLSAPLEFADPMLSDTAAWNERFTLAPGGHSSSFALDSFDYTLEFNAGDKWGFTLGFEGKEEDAFDWDSVRAGAFFDFTPRLRFGGELSFSSDIDEMGLRLEDQSGDASEFKLQSAFRF